MNQHRLRGRALIMLAGISIAFVLALIRPLWQGVAAGLVGLGLAGNFVRIVLAESARRESELNDHYAAEAQDRARLETAVGRLGKIFSQKLSLEDSLGECSTILRNLAEIAANVAEDAALVQEDLAAFVPTVAGVRKGEAPALGAMLKELAAETETSIDEARALTESIGEMRQEIDRIGQDYLAYRNGIADMVDACTSEAAAGKEMLAEGKAAVTAWDEPMGEIGRSVQVATDLAEQVRILGVNASIEALRSGEAGRGFMLIAEEAERLSDRIGRAAQQIAGQLEAGEQQALRVTTVFKKLEAVMLELADKGGRLAGKDLTLKEAAYDREGGERLNAVLSRIALGVKTLADRLVGVFAKLDPSGAEEARTASARLFTDAGALVGKTQALGTRIEDLYESARQTQANFAAAAAAGQELAQAVAHLEELNNRD